MYLMYLMVLWYFICKADHVPYLTWRYLDYSGFSAVFIYLFDQLLNK